MTFFTAIFGFIVGILLRSLFSIPPFFVFTTALGLWVFFFLFRRSVIMNIAIFALFLFLGVLRFDISANNALSLGAKHIKSYTGSRVAFEGVVRDDPDLRDNSVSYTLDKLLIIADGGEKAVEGRLLFVNRLYPRFSFGDRLKVSCDLRDPNTRGVSYAGYLAKNGIYALCWYPKSVAVVGHKEGGALRTILLFIKNNFSVQAGRVLPSPHSGLLTGLLIGDTSRIPSYLNDALVKTGTIHIVAISGYNISIIIVLLLSAAPYLYLSRRFAWALVLPVLIGFIIITGAESSVVRAGIMALITALSIESGRLSDVSRVLALASFAMLVHNPYLLVFDVGFQLSFAATLGIIYLSPKISSFLRPRLKFRFLTEPIAATGSANLAVSPLLLWHFGRLSLISPIVNVLIIWIIPLAMALGFAAVLLSYVAFPIGEFAGWFEWAVLEYVILVVRFFA